MMSSAAKKEGANIFQPTTNHKEHAKASVDGMRLFCFVFATMSEAYSYIGCTCML